MRSIGFAQSVPIGHWPFDEGSGSFAADVSGNGNNGTVNGATWTKGRIGGALRFDDRNANLELSAEIVRGTKTITAWIKPETSSRGTIVGSKLFQMGGNAKLMHLGDSVYVYSDDQLAIGHWNHVALVLNEAEGKVYFYIDGHRSGSAQTTNFDAVVAPDNQIGQSDNTPFNGVIDDVRIYDKALSEAEISDLANPGAVANQPPVVHNQEVTTQVDTSTGITLAANDADGDELTYFLTVDPIHGALSGSPPDMTYTPDFGYIGPDSFTFYVNDSLESSDTATVSITVNEMPASATPIGHWPFDEGSGSFAADVSGNGNNGTVNGATWTNGRIGGALRFDDRNANVELSAEIVRGTKTITAWIKPETSSRGTIVGSKLFQMGGNAKLMHLGDSVYLYSDDQLAIGHWNHVALVLNEAEGKVYFYIDGHRSGSAQTTNFDAVVAPDNQIGQSDNTPFNGVIDDVRIYDKALSEAEISDLANPGAGGNQSPVAENDNYGVNENQSLIISAPGVLGNDTDADEDELRAVLVSGVSNGTLTLNADGSFNYEPNANFNGADSFSYSANDGEADSNIATVTITVASVNATVSPQVIVISPASDWVAAINALQPGDVGQLEPGRYTTGTGIATVSVKGTPEHPITIRGAGGRETTISGEAETVKAGHALYLLGCADLIIENLNFTNPSPFGIDGREAYSFDAREKLRNGIALLNSVRITIRQCRFADIATRGIFVSNDSSATIERNLFVRVGDDTASGDVTFSGNDIILRGNLLAGNVSGFINGGATTGVLTLERNLSIYHKWESGFGFKDHTLTPAVIRNNVVYCHLSNIMGVSLNRGTRHVRMYGNVIHGRGGANGGGEAMMIRGRADTLADIEVVGNWFDAYGQLGNGRGRGIHIVPQLGNLPAPVRDVWILHNVFHQLGMQFRHAEGYISDINVYNNIFQSAFILSSGVTNLQAATNLYDEMAPWDDDRQPIVGTPIYTEAPVGSLAPGSPGKGQATVLSGRDFGPDVGIPQSFGSLVSLEDAILSDLAAVFSESEIREAMEQGGLKYPASQPPQVQITATPDSGAAPLTVSFSASGQNLVFYEWFFGDRTTSRSAQAIHTYSGEAGVYRVTLVAINEQGEAVSDSVLITVIGSGVTASESGTSAFNRVIDGDMEFPHTGAWTSNQAMLSKDFETVHAGASSLRVEGTVGDGIWAQQQMTDLNEGERCHFQAWMKKGTGRTFIMMQTANGETLYQSEDAQDEWGQVVTDFTNPLDNETIYVRLCADGGGGYFDDVVMSDVASQAAPVRLKTPVAFNLYQNYPNPFNPETWIPYQLGAPARVTITIYDTSGDPVRSLNLGYQAAGLYMTRNRAAQWDGRNNMGESVGSGLYFYHLHAGAFSETRKMLILK